MKFVALLRGINVGTSVRINMKELKEIFERKGLTAVSTYINSGNILFQSEKNRDDLRKQIELFLLEEYKQKIKTLVIDEETIVRIANAIPADWTNDDNQKTDVAYLFEEVNNEGIMELLPVKKEYLQLVYVDGALIWNVDRINYNKSQLNKIISNKIYKEMTVRNVNTARYLASVMKKM